MSKSSVEPQPKHSDGTSMYDLRKKLFKEAMNQKWETVLDLYKDEKVQDQHITRAKDTLLHVAISSATEKIVLGLLNIVKLNKDMPKILNIKNKNGYTPLHLAAALGLDKVCRRIAKMCPDMVTSARTDRNETPLFSAVRHRNKNAFFELEVAIHKKQKLTIDENCLWKRDITHCRRGDGNNILHYAIKGEQFDLAYEIIQLYPQLVNYVNSSGETALHTLANKPSVFKSGARFGLYDTIIYHCTITEPLEYDFGNFMEKVPKDKKDEQTGILQKDENKILPPTYKVCIDLFSLMKKTISCLFNTYASRQKIGIYMAFCTDVENPSSSAETDKAPSSDEEDAYQSPISVEGDPSSSSETGKAPSSVQEDPYQSPISVEEDPYQSPISVEEDPSSSSEPIAASSSKTTYSPEPVAASSSKTAGAQKERTRQFPLIISCVKAREQKEPRRMFPQNYDMMVLFFKIIVKLLLVVLGIGLTRLQTIRKIKQQHKNAKKIMKELVEHSTLWEYEEASGGKEPDDESSTVINRDTHIGSEFPSGKTSVEPTVQPVDEKTQKPSEADDESSTVIKKDLPPEKSSVGATDQGLDEKTQKPSEGKTPVEDTHIGSGSPPEKIEATDQASPVLVAAKSGITEMVKRILKTYPVAVMDRDKDRKNIILLAVEHRQVNVYKYMLDFPTVKSVFRKVDKDENSALHLAAKLSHSRPWSIPGAALQMQWESKWYKYVHSSSEMNQEIITRINKDGKKPEDVFIENHEQLVKDGSTWLTSTSQSCSVVAALVATVAFASASTVPGGVNQDSGFPILSSKPVFQLFAISSLVALCFSVTSLVMFLAILTSRYEVRDFNRGLPVKLILGLTSLFLSIAAMLISFCAGDFFVVENKLKVAVYPIYAVMCFPVTFFAIAQLPLYIDLIKATIKNVPERTEKVHVY